MAVSSFMVPLGTPAPPFALPSLTGQTISPADYAPGQPLLVMFLSNHCPYVRHIERELGKLIAEYADRELAAVAISSNNVETHPDDGPAGLAEQVDRAGFTFPYLLDSSQEVAKAYRAACTPDFFLYDVEHRLAYRGEFDASRPGNDLPVTGQELRVALDLVLAGQPVPEPQVPSIGCNIKWKPGNEPY
ncbi:MAG TPA: thioredoxin family protein [Pseudonocardiaceae bacterium]|nr:thioredoxin family protein [Pseudonocardiaceae bacterium]